MDVTCERCSTAYEFDDALVSERGTTVKCTTCGHQFKVRRPQPAGTPERWLVRTIDGRELEFRALRELQAAIAQTLISRDDVLSRGGSRPRRLGSIAELEPFFASAAGGVHATTLGLGPKAPPRGRTPTPPNLGPPPPHFEGSVAIPLPRGRPDPSSSDDPTTVMQSSAAPRRVPSVPPPAPPRRSTPPPPLGTPLPGVVVSPAGAPQLPFGDEMAAGAVTREAHEQLRGMAAEMRASPARVTARDDLSAPTVPFQMGAVLDPVTVRALAHDDWTPPPADALTINDRMSRARPSPAPQPAPRVGSAGSSAWGSVTESRFTPPPAPTSSPDAPPPRSSDPSARNSDATARASDASSPRVDMASESKLTPTPAPVRGSYVNEDTYGEPRFSTVMSTRRTGAARWIVGMVVAGMLALAFATVGRRMLVSTAPQKGSEADARIGTLLADGEKSLLDGDFESAKEQFDKASILGERDARVVADLARLAAARADVEWLRARLLAEGDPELGAVKQAAEQAAQRARKAADHAAEVAPTDPAVIRSRIDALRLAGDLDGARKLVSGISAQSAQPDNALALAELDLAETKPDWSTVIGRLRTALSTEQNLGRARSMLVYALARSGDTTAAKAELERLGALQRAPHPLLGALRLYVTRESKAIDPSSLPDSSAKPLAGKLPAAGGPAGVTTGSVAGGPAPHEPREPREPRERPAPPSEPKPPEPLAPTGPIDTSDLPGVKAPPSPPPTPPTSTGSPPPSPPPAAPPPTSTVPPGVDTSDLPGFK
jgi:predicted Zn finger-like uncharacterized protein